MIGNIAIVGDANSLNSYLAVRQQYLYSYKMGCAQKGLNYEPHKIKIVVVNDVEPNGDDYIVGSILLPKSSAMFHIVDGDIESFKQQYFYDLDSDPNIQEYIAVLLTGILERDIDFVLCFNNDDFTMWTTIAMALTEYMYSRYGVVCFDGNAVMNDYTILLSQSILPEAVTNVQSIIDNYHLSNRDGSQLFVRY